MMKLTLTMSFVNEGNARISCKDLLDAGNTTSGSYSLKVNGNSFQVGFHAFYMTT